MASNLAPHIERQSLLGLPAELRINIFHWLFRSLVVEVERGPRRRHSEAEPGDDEPADEGISHGISPLPGLPRDLAALRLVCKRIHRETNDNSWHTLVKYHFPSTVAFVDVLSQWPQEKVSAMKFAHIVDTPLPVYGFVNPGFYVTHNANEALAMFPGLQLDVLTMENIWLRPSGEPTDGWCLIATSGTVKRLLTTSGWKRVEYLSGVLGLSPTQMKQLDTAVKNYRTEKQEPDFRYQLGRVRPLVHSRENLLDRSEGPEDVEETYRHVKQWYDEHPEVRRPRNENDYLDEVKDLSIAMWAERGQNAGYVEDGEALSSTLQSLKDNITWQELRQTDDYLVDDGLDDPSGHL